MYQLFPPIVPFRTRFLKVSNLHTLYVEESGNPQGKPIISFHGGPGSQTKNDHRQFYNPAKYRIILFDQRGCGKSTPTGEIRENTTQDLVADIERIRRELRIDRWVVHGGSWGSTLALAYAQEHPGTVKALILRGIFTFRQWETDWFMGNARIFFPDRWEEAARVLPPDFKGSVSDYLYSLYTDKESPLQLKTIESFNIWHRSLMKLSVDEADLRKPVSREAVAGERILMHYIRNRAFLREGQLLENAGRLKGIPSVIIQGRYDMCCPPRTAWELHKRMPHADFHMIPTAGHKSDEPGTLEKIIEYTEKFSSL